MNLEQTIRLLALARAGNPGMSIVEGQSAMWHKVLCDITFDDAVEALIHHLRTEHRVVTTADILGNAKAKNTTTPQPPAYGAEPRRDAPMPEPTRQVLDQFSALQQAKKARDKAAREQRHDEAEQHRLAELDRFRQTFDTQETP